jgi:superfamily I DNA/RNA helicase
MPRYKAFLSVLRRPAAIGLEYRAVAITACDNEMLPSWRASNRWGRRGDLQEVYDTERGLLYVACTRARDHLLVTGVDPSSDFLDDPSLAISVRNSTGEN